jgi:hypothetical protein
VASSRGRVTNPVRLRARIKVRAKGKVGARKAVRAFPPECSHHRAEAVPAGLFRP